MAYQIFITCSFEEMFGEKLTVERYLEILTRFFYNSRCKIFYILVKDCLMGNCIEFLDEKLSNTML